MYSKIHVFVKDGQMGFSKAYDSISEYMTSTFPEYFWTFWFFLRYYLRGSHGLSARRARRILSRGPKGLLTSTSLWYRLLLICLCHVFLFRKDPPAHPWWWVTWGEIWCYLGSWECWSEKWNLPEESAFFHRTMLHVLKVNNGHNDMKRILNSARALPVYTLGGFKKHLFLKFNGCPI